MQTTMIIARVSAIYLIVSKLFLIIKRKTLPFILKYNIWAMSNNSRKIES